MITVEPVNLELIERQLSTIPGAVEKATKRSVKRTLQGGKQDISRKIRARYTIKTSEVTKTLEVTSSGMTGEITSNGGRNPLKLFKISPRKRPKIPPAGGVRAVVVKGQGDALKHAFLQKNGGVYERVGSSRFPIRALTGPSAPGMIGNENVAPEVVAKMQERLGINFAHEANAILGGFA